MPEITQSVNPHAVTRLSDLVQKCTFADVEQKIRIHYGARELDKYRRLYEALGAATPEISEKTMFVQINAFMEDEEEDVRAEEFDEDDSELMFDVSAYNPDEETVYSIASATYGEFLGLGVAPYVLRDYSPASILAHCLYELSAYGFEDRADG
ncbi:MAG: hypothetical protein IKL00_10895 [Oscillospiraceae bacterium]|nr:hypothetical protein [Oscillospiraceae bacterium]